MTIKGVKQGFTEQRGVDLSLHLFACSKLWGAGGMLPWEILVLFSVNSQTFLEAIIQVPYIDFLSLPILFLVD